MTVLIGNIIDFIASMVMIYTGTVRKKSKILVLQTVQLGLQTLSMLVLGGITGAISNVLSCIRNLLCYKEKLNWIWKIVLTAASLGMTIAFNKQGLIGWFPFIICTIYIVFMDTKSPLAFKVLVTATSFPWVFYFLAIRSYSGAFFAAASTITNAVSLWQMFRDRKIVEKLS